MARGDGKRRVRFILPALYLAFAVYAWIDFAGAARDGLANLGLMLVTLPIALVGGVLSWLVGGGDFVLLPRGPSYLVAHAIYYLPAVAITAAMFWRIGRAIDRRIG